jgi:LmbE family N-acetylglucosaminyl deacetylase
MIVLHDTASLERECPRMIELLRQFSTAVKINETMRPAKQVYDPFVIFDASHYLHRFHYDHLRAAQGTNDVVGTQQLLDRFNEIWEASAPSISAHTTGLK